MLAAQYPTLLRASTGLKVKSGRFQQENISWKIVSRILWLIPGIGTSTNEYEIFGVLDSDFREYALINFSILVDDLLVS